MAELVWDATGQRFFETGTDRGVLYVGNDPGVAWNGIRSVAETPKGGETQAYYINGVKYLSRSAPEEFRARLTAYYSPPEFDECDGTTALITGFEAMHQPKKRFGLSYRTKLGNDVSIDKGYKIHLVYNAIAAPSTRLYESISATPSAGDLSWEISADPIFHTGIAPTSHFVVNTEKASPAAVNALETILYGTPLVDPRLPLPDEIVTLFANLSEFALIDNGDGTYTVFGTDEVVSMLDATTFQIVSDKAQFIDADSYTLTSD